MQKARPKATLQPTIMEGEADIEEDPEFTSDTNNLIGIKQLGTKIDIRDSDMDVTWEASSPTYSWSARAST